MLNKSDVFKFKSEKKNLKTCFLALFNRRVKARVSGANGAHLLTYLYISIKLELRYLYRA